MQPMMIVGDLKLLLAVTFEFHLNVVRPRKLDSTIYVLSMYVVVKQL